VAVPEVTNSFSPLLKSIFSSSVTVAGLSAILMSLIIPRQNKTAKDDVKSETGSKSAEQNTAAS